MDFLANRPQSLGQDFRSPIQPEERDLLFEVCSTDIEKGRRLPPSSRRAQSISQSIRNGVNELRSIGRRLSVSFKSKNGKMKTESHLQDGGRSGYEQQDVFYTEDDRPKSRGWLLRSPSTRRRPSLPLLNVNQVEPNPNRYSIIGPVPGSATRPPIVPDSTLTGAGARAAAAAQNEAFHATRTPPLPPMPRRPSQDSDLKVASDSESGIGIDLETQSPRASQLIDNSITRYDPTGIFATELTEHMLCFLDPHSLLRAGAVSRRWRTLALSQSVWREVFNREFAPRGFLSGSSPNLALGMGKGIPNQDWRKMFKVRRLIEKRWQNGEAAAIYLNGHKDSVYCVQFDGNKIVTGSRDHTVRVWDARTYQCIRKLGPPQTSGNRHNLRRGEVEPQGSLPFCTIEYSSPDPIHPGPHRLWHDQSILCLQYDDEIMVTGSSDFSCIVWSIRDDYQPLFRLEGHKAGVLDVCIDSTRIITCSKDTLIKVWDRHTGRLLKTLRGHTGPVNAVQLRGNLLASASGDGMSRLWRLDEGVCIKEFSSQNRGLACVEFSEDGRTIFAGGNDQVIYEYDTFTGSTVRQLKGHTDLVRSLYLDSMNGRIISGSYDASVKVWDCRGSKHSPSWKINFEGWTTSWILSAKSDYRKIVCTSQDGRVVIMDFGYGIEGVELLEP